MTQLIETDLFGAARRHFQAGRAVIAVNREKRPYHEGWNEYLKRPQTENELREEFSKAVYGAAMVLWPACPFAVLDFDGPHANDAWESTGIKLPATARIVTRSGGEHLYFLMPETPPAQLKRRIRIAKINCDCTGSQGKRKTCGVDLLIHGYAVIPPTPGYKEDPEHQLDSAVDIPPEILELLRSESKCEKTIPSCTSKRVAEGERHDTLVRLAGSMCAKGMSIDAIRAALKADNEARFDPPVSDSEIESVIKSASAWWQGTMHEHLTDLGNARRLISQFGRDLRYSTRGGWHIWDGLRWRRDDTDAIERFAKDTIRHIDTEAASIDETDERDTFYKHARRSEADARIRAMINIAKSEPEVVVRQEELDRDVWLLNVRNGTLNLKTGELRSHRREDLITKVVPIEFSRTATCPRWENFLEQITNGDDGLIRFLQKSIGYSLTGDIREQCLFILYGTGANGKSTFVNAVSSLLNDYAMQTRAESLMIGRSEQTANDVARLAGARFVSAGETEFGKHLAEAMLKQLTGGDKMTAVSYTASISNFSQHSSYG